MIGNESWAQISDYPYLVSTHGRVKSEDRVVIQTSRWGTPMSRPYKGKIRKLHSNPNEYLTVDLSVDGVKKYCYVHRLVAIAFVDGYFDGALVNHKDGVKTNNHYTNLEWVTEQENIDHAIETGLKPDVLFGIESPGCKGLVEVVDKNGIVVDTFAGTKEMLAKGYSKQVYQVLCGIAKTYKGLYFRRVSDDR